MKRRAQETFSRARPFRLYSQMCYRGNDGGNDTWTAYPSGFRRITVGGLALWVRPQSRRTDNRLKIRERVCLWHYANDFDVDRSHGVFKTQIVSINPGDFFGQVTLNGVELCVGPNFESERRPEFSATPFDLGPGGGDPLQLLATGFEQSIQRMA